MDWRWNLISVILCIVTHQDNAQACDSECKAALILEFKNVVKEELKPVNLKLDQLGNDIGTIKSSGIALDSKFEDNLNDIETIKSSVIALDSKFEDRVNGIGTIKSSVISLDSKCEDKLNGIGDIHATTEKILEHTKTIINKQESMSIYLQSVKADTDTLDTKALYIAQNIHAVKQSVPELKHTLSLLEQTMTDGIHAAVILLEDSIESVKVKTTNTSTVLSQIQQDTNGLKALTEPIYEIKESIKGIEQGFEVANESNHILQDIQLDIELCIGPLNATILDNNMKIEQVAKQLDEIHNNRTESEKTLPNCISLEDQDQN
ncbi:unnamed protein product, partial [Meganyctiphanes norvegica]